MAVKIIFVLRSIAIRGNLIHAIIKLPRLSIKHIIIKGNGMDA